MPQDVSPSHNVTKIILVRHGSTKLNSGGDGNSSECIRGWLDIPLSPKGIKEAQEVAEKLKEHDFDGIISSDLIRAEKTAQIISEATGVPILGVSRGLRPWDVGTLAGKPVENCLDILHDHIANKPDVKLGGGESFNEFKERCLNCFDQIRKAYAGKTIAIVAHHRNERLLAAWKACGGGLPETVKPDMFYEKGIPPAHFVRHTLAKGPGDEPDADDQPEPKKKRKARTVEAKFGKGVKSIKTPPAVAATSKVKPKDPSKVYSKTVGGESWDEVAKAELNPKVPDAIKKRPQTWAASVRGSILES